MNDLVVNNIHNIAFIGIKKISGNGILQFNIRGTCLVFKKKLLLTCAHVYNEIPDNFKGSIICGVAPQGKDNLKEYNFYDLKFIDKDDKRDFALFSINDPKNFLSNHGVDKSIIMNEAEINNLNIAETVNFVGFPLANEFMDMRMGVTLLASQCVIGSMKFSINDKKIDFILIDKLVNPGSSGSPTFYKNKIIGLTSGNLNQTHRIGEKLINIPVGIGIIRTSNYILDLLNKNNL